MSDMNAAPTEHVVEPAAPHCASGARVEIITSRDVPLGGPRAMTVKRTLPQRQRSLIGAWCFCDHYGPDDVSTTGGMDVAPHPHMGLQTVSWLFEGAIMHHDAAGYHAVVKPGEANFMTAGHGICHSETSTQDTTSLNGVQLWVALPNSARNMERRFENYKPKPYHFDGGQALVFMGSLFGQTSPISSFTPLVGAEIRIEAGKEVTFSVNPDFEHGLLLDAGSVELEGVTVQRSELAYTGIGETTLTITNIGDSEARTVLIGGEPFTEPIVMWWNFVGRTHDEIVEAREEWQARSERFGHVEGYVGHHQDGPSWLPAPHLPNAKIKTRANPSPVARPEMRIDQPKA
ncbi:MAG: pirin family protein [Actinomycetaceae bacterium]|nr:pirin family protein [Arcanobacterium sp.]MDD7504793.1 pirin family protein [Actinomycetaceae bacterium]MDY6142678.1 pirin family protein [Arcanobacterium sp.]